MLHLKSKLSFSLCVEVISTLCTHFAGVALQRLIHAAHHNVLANPLQPHSLGVQLKHSPTTLAASAEERTVTVPVSNPFQTNDNIYTYINIWCMFRKLVQGQHISLGRLFPSICY